MGYWLLVILLVGFGVLAIFSIGAPFLLIGLTLALLWPFRSLRAVWLPVIVGEIALIVGYVLIAPLGCTTAVTSSDASAWTACDNLVGLDYSGAGTYSPSHVPAVVVAISAGLVTASATGLYSRRRAARRRIANEQRVAKS
jgi:hypothetical protein